MAAEAEECGAAAAVFRNSDGSSGGGGHRLQAGELPLALPFISSPSPSYDTCDACRISLANGRGAGKHSSPFQLRWCPTAAHVHRQHSNMERGGSIAHSILFRLYLNSRGFEEVQAKLCSAAKAAAVACGLDLHGARNTAQRLPSR